PAFDVHSLLMSVPGLLGTSLVNIPADVPYLFPDPQRVERWRQELADVAAFQIGIVWSGNVEHKRNRMRSVPLVQFLALARVPGARLISLQKGPGLEEWQALDKGAEIVELGSRLNSFMDTAAVMKNLDLVIACDTASAHLAGALGVPVWVALPFAPDW